MITLGCFAGRRPDALVPHTNDPSELRSDFHSTDGRKDRYVRASPSQRAKRNKRVERRHDCDRGGAIVALTRARSFGTRRADRHWRM
jgi:hypothetical protein